MILGVVPMAGEGSRWGGHLKELLPIGDGKWLCDSALEALKRGGADRICIVTSPSKASAHFNHFSKEKYKDFNLFFVMQRERQDIWGAIKATFPYKERINLFAMPDTVIPIDTFWKAFNNYKIGNFALGCFKTTTPERFGVIRGNRISNKQGWMPNEPETLNAWGTLIWTEDVINYWTLYDKNITDYTKAFNEAMDFWGYQLYDMDFYTDFASFEDYKKWIAEQS